MTPSMRYVSTKIDAVVEALRANDQARAAAIGRQVDELVKDSSAEMTKEWTLVVQRWAIVVDLLTATSRTAA